MENRSEVSSAAEIGREKSTARQPGDQLVVCPVKPATAGTKSDMVKHRETTKTAEVATTVKQVGLSEMAATENPG